MIHETRWNSGFSTEMPPPHIMENLRIPGDLNKNEYAYVIGRLYRTPDQDPNDEAIITSEMENIDQYDITCKPVYLEHQYDNIIGNIFRYHFDKDTRSLWVGLLLHNGPGVRGEVVDKVRSGKLKSLSIGLVRPSSITSHSAKKEGNRTHKCILEASLVEEPKIEGCHIVEVHSKLGMSNTAAPPATAAAAATNAAASTQAANQTAAATTAEDNRDGEHMDADEMSASGVLNILKSLIKNKNNSTTTTTTPDAQQQQTQQSGKRKAAAITPPTNPTQAVVSELEKKASRVENLSSATHMNPEAQRRYQELLSGKPVTNPQDATMIASYLSDLPEASRAATLVQFLANYSEMTKFAEEARRKEEAAAEQYKSTKANKLKPMLDYMVSEAKTLDIKDMPSIEGLTGFFVDPKNSKIAENFEHMFDELVSTRTKNEELAKRAKELEDRESKMAMILDQLERSGTLSGRTAKKAKLSMGIDAPRQPEILAHGASVVNKYLGSWFQQYTEKGVGEQKTSTQDTTASGAATSEQDTGAGQIVSVPGGFNALKSSSMFSVMDEKLAKPLNNFNPITHMFPSKRIIDKAAELAKSLSNNGGYN